MINAAKNVGDADKQTLLLGSGMNVNCKEPKEGVSYLIHSNFPVKLFSVANANIESTNNVRKVLIILFMIVLYLVGIVLDLFC